MSFDRSWENPSVDFEFFSTTQGCHHSRDIAAFESVGTPMQSQRVYRVSSRRRLFSIYDIDTGMGTYHCSDNQSSAQTEHTYVPDRGLIVLLR